MGCTICHGGAGEALDFRRADHRPTDDEEATRWRAELGWSKQPHWDHPMLGSKHHEAGCLQCHQDSLELIAEDAPTLYEGYRLFERHGCYACHEVAWFPTSRRPGPSLARIRAKTTQGFADAWIRGPDTFRPGAAMPRFFTGDPAAESRVVAPGRAERGEPITRLRWDDAARAAALAFVWDRASDEPLPEPPVGGDASRGREVFRLAGCLACHETTAAAPTFRPEGERGPNLRGIALKVTPPWLFAWLDDPSAWWSEARMPDLRLTAREAADVVAYIFEDPEGVFTSAPEGWELGAGPYDREELEGLGRWSLDREAVEELARRHLDRIPGEELERRLRGEWADDQVLLVAVGEKVVLDQGCHSCHEIPGLEDALANGNPMTTWGSKTTDRLLWGHVPERAAAEQDLSGLAAHRWGEDFRAYRENYLGRKLSAPRNFEPDSIRDPRELLRMPAYALDPGEVEALTTFALGLVEDEARLARMTPTPARLREDEGLRSVRRRNCAGCHVLEHGRIELSDRDGERHVVRGSFLPFEDEVVPPSLEGFAREVREHEARLRETSGDPEARLEEVAVLLREPAPGLGDAGDVLLVEDVDGVVPTPGRGGDVVGVVAEHYLRPGSLVLDVDGELRGYEAEPHDRIRWSFAPPELADAGARLQRDWIHAFLLDPSPVRRQLRIRMPSVAWDEREAGAVADHLALRAGAPLGAEVVPQRQPSHRDVVLGAEPDLLASVRELAVKGPRCTRCHHLRGEVPGAAEGPIDWAPDLDGVRERIRPDWARAWITDPSRVLPGTAMPVNFPLDELTWQDLRTGFGAEQIEDVLTWLYNLDRDPRWR